MNYCKKPDREVPEIICEQPLPCPYHTVIIDMQESPTIIIPVTIGKRINKKLLNRLKKIAMILKEGKS